MIHKACVWFRSCHPFMTVWILTSHFHYFRFDPASHFSFPPWRVSQAGKPRYPSKPWGEETFCIFNIFLARGYTRVWVWRSSIFSFLWVWRIISDLGESWNSRFQNWWNYSIIFHTQLNKFHGYKEGYPCLSLGDIVLRICAIKSRAKNVSYLK